MEAFEEPTGCNHFRDELRRLGYRIMVGWTGEGNECNWYAYKRSQYEGRECECNEGRNIQVVVHPVQYTFGGRTDRSSEMEVTGEVDGVWFTQKAYGVDLEDMLAGNATLEKKLINAWNALK